MKYSIVVLTLTLSLGAVDNPTGAAQDQGEQDQIIAVLDNVKAVVELYEHLAQTKKIPLDKQYELQRMGENLLMLASYFGHAQVVTALLKKGVPVDSTTYYGSTPLFYAIEQGQVEVVKILLDYGANLFIQNRYNETPARLIVRSQHGHLTELLAMYSGQPNK